MFVRTHQHLTIAIRIGFDYADYCFQAVNRENLLLIESLVAYWQVIEKHLRALLKPDSSFNQSNLLSEIDALSFCQRGQTFIEQFFTITHEHNLEFLAYSLRLISCFYVFIRGERNWTQRILEHLFRIITAEQVNLSKSNPLQKQASCLIDLCLNYGHVIFIYFNELFQVTLDLVRRQTSLEQQQGRLAGWQWSVLVECLGILLNYSTSFEQQANLIHQLVQPFAEILSKFDVAVNDLPSFIDYIGLKPEVTSESKSKRTYVQRQTSGKLG